MSDAGHNEMLARRITELTMDLAKEKNANVQLGQEVDEANERIADLQMGLKRALLAIPLASTAAAFLVMVFFIVAFTTGGNL